MSMTKTAELVGYPGYSVTDNGQIYSQKSAKMLKQNPNWAGYMLCCISHLNHKITIVVHKAVAAAFVPNPDLKPQVNHIDGNKANNTADNLEWVTAKENMLHAVKSGLHKVASGELSHKSKLNQQAVNEIRTMYATGNYTQEQLGAIYGCHQTTVLKILARKTWR